MKTLKNIFTILLLVAVVSSCAEKKARYVFYFIGDGMGFTHVAAAEAYLSQERGVIGMDTLSFTRFPVLGLATTYSASNPITCSSAAGTALATGFKTNNGMLGVTPDGEPLTSIAYKIHDAGYAVGITSTVGVNHATPAAFYGHSKSRNSYYDIIQELPGTGFEFFAGGGIIDAFGENNDQKSAYDIISEGGYTVTYGIDEFNARKNDEKFFLIDTVESEDAVPYAFGRPKGALTQAQIVKAAIEVLERNEKGFFLMSEGGQIDWGAHSQNLAATIFEVIDFGTAIQVAVDFYEKHPDETLIVITADHETGGIALGRDHYTFDLTVIDELTSPDAPHSVKDYMSSKEAVSDINERAGIGWTTFSHCGAPVPVWAIGVGSEKFAARQDNTDIPKKICSVMGVEF